MSTNRRQRRAEKAGKASPTGLAGGPGAARTLLAQAVRRHQAGDLAGAVADYERALQLNPKVPEALSNLGLALKDLGRPAEAVACYEQALALKPDAAEVLSNLGAALKDLGRLDAAVASFRRALSLKPDYPGALSNLGNVLKEQGQFDEAIECYRQALARRPDYPEALSNLGNALRERNLVDEAVGHFRRALALKPDFPEALSNCGNALKDQGLLDEAIECYEQAIRLRPRFAEAHSNLLMTLHYSERLVQRNTLDEARRFARLIEVASSARQVFSNSADPHRRLRIGYVSADLRSHPVGIFLDGILASHDPAMVEIFCYSNARIEDDVTRRLRQRADHWRIIAGVSDTAADAAIRRDAIDILVDLSGHTSGNRLPLFALKPAPVQATWLGYVDTTGLTAMDHILADRIVVPPGDEASFTEKVWRLPQTYFCFTPPAFDVPLVDRPAGRPLTFGSFNNRAKLTPATIGLWAGVLNATPGSRLLVKTAFVDNPTIRQEILGQFAVHGIGAERLTLEGPSSRADLLAAYNRIDIALDPFPYGGGLTTAEALWMGVPVVTLQGPRWVSRAAASILTTVGLPELVALDVEGYVRTAKALADDRRRLEAHHRELRQTVEKSPLCDGPRLTRAVEGFYRDMWAAWCAGRSAGRA